MTKGDHSLTSPAKGKMTTGDISVYFVLII